jgi:hypothetical protein
MASDGYYDEMVTRLLQDFYTAWTECTSGQCSVVPLVALLVQSLVDRGRFAHFLSYTYLTSEP